MNATFEIVISKDKDLKMSKYGETGKKLRCLKQMSMNYTMILPTEEMHKEIIEPMEKNEPIEKIKEYIDLEIDDK
jgi:hypothetical protein